MDRGYISYGTTWSGFAYAAFVTDEAECFTLERPWRSVEDVEARHPLVGAPAEPRAHPRPIGDIPPVEFENIWRNVNSIERSSLTDGRAVA